MPLVKDPVVKINTVSVRTLSLSELELDITLDVENPNLIGATLRELPFTVSCVTEATEHKIASGNAHKVKVPGRGNAIVTVPVTTHNAGILRAAAACVAKGGIEVEVKGTALLDFGVISRSVPFSKTIQVTTGQLAAALLGNSKGT